MMYGSIVVIGVGFVVLGVGFGIGKIGGLVMDVIVCQFEVFGKIQIVMIIVVVFVEGVVLFGVVVGFFGNVK